MLNNMKKIGEGWQYSVYDLQNGRVLKKLHSLIKTYWVILKDIFPFNTDPITKLPSYARNSKIKALASAEILTKKNIPLSWLGNPKFINGLDYEQDKALPLHDVFTNSNTEQIKLLIDKFIIFNKQLMEIGVIDKSFNITKNYGLNNNGDVILIDIGELFDNPVRIKKQLIDRAWDKSYVAGCIKNKEAQKYFIEKMDENFSVK